MKKSLFILLFALLHFASIGQITPTTVSGGVVTLSGKGKIGGTKDGAQWRRYKFARSGNFMLSAYFRSLTNSNNSFTGIAFRNETTGLKSDGGLPAVALFYENDTLKAKTKLTQDSKFVDVAVLANVKAPGWLKIEKNNNTVKFYYSTSPENATTPAYTQMTAVANVFTGWNTITQNFATGNRLGTTSTAIVSNITFGAVTGDGAVPCANGATFDILSVTQNNGNIYDVNFNAANFSSVNVDIKNSSNVSVRNFTSAVTARPISIDIGTQSTGTYTLTFTGQSCSGVASKNFDVIGPVVTGGGTGGTSGQTSFVNILKTIPVETQTDKYSVAPFSVTGGTKLKNWVNGKQIAKFPVVWHSKLTNFVSANKKVWDLGISSPVDIVPNLANQEGDGVRCLDYILYANPNSGQPFQNGIDTDCSAPNNNINTFVSSRPFQFRVKGEGGTVVSMDGWTNEQLYDEGVKYTNGDKFGFGDVINGKFNIAFTVTDVENGEHGRREEIPIKIGMANTSFGYIVGMYNQAINIVNPDLSHYPLNYISGGYVANRIKLDGTPALDGNGNLQQNNVINDAWKPENKVTIPSRGINNKGLIDFENALESSEVSTLASSAFHQGDIINYDNDNRNLTRVTNKFGLNRNAEHIVAHTKYATEVRKWHLRKNFNDRKFFTLTKDLCDRLNIGLTNYGKFGSYVDNTDLQAKHLPRDLVFMNTMTTAFNGSFIYQWDRNTIGKIIDGKHGQLFGINLLNQRKALSQGNLSFVDLVDDFDYKLWTSEISYDGGVTWKQEKGTDNIMSQTSIIHVQCITSSGVWAVWLCRPENTELKACKLRITYNGVVKYLDITPNMWETTDPNYATTPLSSLPDAAKDFYYDLIDVSGSTTGGPTTTTVNPPTFTSNPTTPKAGSSVTFSVSNCAGTVKIFADDAQVSTATSYTVASPIVNTSYSATCTVSGVSSVASSAIVIQAATPTPPPSGGVMITEPNKPTYYFTNGQPKSFYVNDDGTFTNNLPVIYRSNTRSVSNYNQPTVRAFHPTIKMESNYSMANDLVWIQNSKVKFGINLLRGGQLAWASLIGATTNLVYNGYDGGFQVTLDAYQKKDGFSKNGKFSRFQHSDIYQFKNTPKPQPPAPNPDNIPQLSSYNTTMGGDFVNNSQSLLYHYRDGNSYIVAVRPIFYTIDSEFSEVIIETKYTLEADAISLKIEHKYISKRTDGQYDGGGFDGCAAPACFLVNTLSKYRVHEGDNLLTGDLPIENYGQPILGAQTNKKYLCVYNPTSNLSLGIYKIGTGSQFAHLKQLEVNGSPGTEFGGGFTYVDFNTSFVNSVVEPIPNRNDFEKTMVSYIMVGNNPMEIDNEASRLKILTGN